MAGKCLVTCWCRGLIFQPFPLSFDEGILAFKHIRGMMEDPYEDILDGRDKPIEQPDSFLKEIDATEKQGLSDFQA